MFDFDRISAVFDNAIIVEQTSMTIIQALKGARWMVRLSEAMKDALSCEKPGGAAPKLRSLDLRMGQPTEANPQYSARKANLVN
jgi:hypothetical protein